MCTIEVIYNRSYTQCFLALFNTKNIESTLKIICDFKFSNLINSFYFSIYASNTQVYNQLIIYLSKNKIYIVKSNIRSLHSIF